MSAWSTANATSDAPRPRVIAAGLSRDLDRADLPLDFALVFFGRAAISASCAHATQVASAGKLARWRASSRQPDAVASLKRRSSSATNSVEKIGNYQDCNEQSDRAN